MKKLVATSLLLVIVLVSLSAYLRLDQSGIGCADWPDCYGQLGAAKELEPSLGSTYERLVQEARQPLSWATPLHRLIASVLGLTVLAMTLMSLRLKRDRLLTAGLLSLTVFLAWLGIYSDGLHNPAVVMGNLSGGFAMLGLLGWMAFRGARTDTGVPAPLRTWLIAALLLACVQIGLGGLTSANFAASACQTLPDCHGSYLPGRDLTTAFDLTRAHNTGPSGIVIGGAERADIHKLHRIAAVVSTAVILLVGIWAFRAGLGVTAIAVLLLVAAEFSVGIAAVVTSLPIGIAVAHNWLAAMLLLGLIRLLVLCNRQQALPR